MRKIRPLTWLLVAATGLALAITAHNHMRGRTNIKAFSWLQEASGSFREKSEHPQRASTIQRRPEQELPQLRTMDSELQSVEQYVANQRRHIEEWYQNNLAILQRWEKERLDELEREQRLAYARFSQNMQNTMSNTSSSMRVDGYGSSNTIITNNGYATTNSHVVANGHSSETTNKSVVGNPSGQLQSELRWIESQRRAVKSELVKLQQKRARLIAELEREARIKKQGIYVQAWRRRASEKSIQQDAVIKQGGGPGLMIAICTSNNKEAFIMMYDGKSYHEGSIVNGFKINKIHQDRVEFEKDGKIWVQEL